MSADTLGALLQVYFDVTCSVLAEMESIVRLVVYLKYSDVALSLYKYCIMFTLHSLFLVNQIITYFICDRYIAISIVSMRTWADLAPFPPDIIMFLGYSLEYVKRSSWYIRCTQ